MLYASPRRRAQLFTYPRWAAVLQLHPKISNEDNEGLGWGANPHVWDGKGSIEEAWSEWAGN
jgi:hypothetical protein